MFAEETCKSDVSGFIGVGERGDPPAGWMALFANGNAAVYVMLTGGVAIHALSLRVVFDRHRPLAEPDSER